jgi:flavorubredoxin
MRLEKIREGVFFAGAVDWDRRLFDSLIPLPEGTSYNAYLVKGRDKTALLDTVDPSKARVLMERLEGVERLDYVVSHHAEQDHSGAIPLVIERYPSAMVVASPRGKDLLVEHLGIAPERVMTVEDGAVIQLGGKTLEFIHTPWVHWPETMSTYLVEDAIAFTCDLFGSHLASPALLSGDSAKVREAAKRYYAEVMMPFRPSVRKNIEKFTRRRVELIAPSHGPAHTEPGRMMEAHMEWASEEVGNTAIVAYASMHGSTEVLADRLTDALARSGVRVERFNLAYSDTGRLAIALVDAATIVIGSPTVLNGAHPLAAQAAFLVNALRPKLRFASVIGSYAWGGRMVEQITGLLSGLKLEMLAPVVSRGMPKGEDLASIERLAAGIAAAHSRPGVIRVGGAGG